MSGSRVIVVVPLVALALGCAASGVTPGQRQEAPPELVGPLSRAEIEAAMPDWVEAWIEARPDAEQALRLAAGPPQNRVTVYLGTWCSDSRRELSRLWRALDDSGGEPPFELRYVGVSRGKDEPRELLAGVDLRYVPTFVVERDGVEAGRIVEVSPNGIELDLGALLRGEASGLLTAREDLQPGEQAQD